jgi:short-subunit dehydrogenase
MSRPAAIVTGASRGIGADVARRLAAKGFDLTISARGIEALETVATSLQDEFAITVRVVSADMSDPEEVAGIVGSHLAAFGRLDTLVLNAGMGLIGPLESFPVRRFEKMFAVNVRSAYIMLQHALPALRVAGGSTPRGGKVIAVASMTGIVGVPNNSAYGATKAALISLCETLNSEESLRGVTATAVCPGYVATPMTEGLSDTVSQDDMLPAEDVAVAVSALTELSRGTVVPTIVLARASTTVWTA